MTNEKKNVQVKVFRWDPTKEAEPHYDTFSLELESGYSIYNAIDYITTNLDPSLSFYASCRIGQCYGCYVKVNGKTVLACNTMLTEDVTIDPFDRKNVLRDLTVKSKNIV